MPPPPFIGRAMKQQQSVEDRTGISLISLWVFLNKMKINLTDAEWQSANLKGAVSMKGHLKRVTLEWDTDESMPE